MAQDNQINELRLKVNEPDDASPYSDAELSDLIDENDGDVDLSAAEIWRNKMSVYSEMTDISEAGSSRKNSQLYKQAQDMANYYAGLSAASAGQLEGVDYPATRRIVRA